MYTISNNVINELLIKNSKFITIICNFNDIGEYDKIMNEIKNEYSDATHYCYAYITMEQKKASDDGEPTGTAGIPILKVLDNNNLVNVLAVVIRYFGGIKLGANGLIRAYTKSISEALKKANVKKLINGFNVNITFNYDKINEIDYLLKDVKINEKIFNDLVTYNIDIEKDFIKKIDCIKSINYKIIKDILILK